METLLTLNEAGSLLLGAGLAQLGVDVNIGLTLIAIGAVLKITIAVLDKYGVIVGGKNNQ